MMKDLLMESNDFLDNCKDYWLLMNIDIES